MPVPYYPSSSPLQQVRHDQQADYFVRRGSVPLSAEPQQRTPEVTGWQPVADIAPIKAATASPQPSKTILAA